MKPYILLTLLICLGLIGCGDAPLPESPVVPPKTTIQPPVPEPAPSSTPKIIKPPERLRPPGDSATFSEFLEHFLIDNLNGLTFINCQYVDNPQYRNWPHGLYPDRKSRFIHIPGSNHNFEFADRPLFITRFHPGEYLIAATFDEMENYTEITVVDDSLRILFGPEDINCQMDEYYEILETQFTTPYTLKTTVSENIGTLNDSTTLHRIHTREWELLPGGKVKELAWNTDFYESMHITFYDQPVNGQYIDRIEAYEEHPDPLPAKDLLPTNSIGILYLEEETEEAYRVTARFHSSKNPLTDTLLSLHYTTDAGINNGSIYTQDMPLTTTPQRITLFDQSGQSYEVDTLTQLSLRFFCENDGPMITDPVYTFEIPKTAYPGNLTPFDERTGKVAAFAIADYRPDLLVGQDSVYTVGEEVISIPYPSGETPLAALFIEQGEADEEGYYCVYLRTYNGDRIFEINCCGP